MREEDVFFPDDHKLCKKKKKICIGLLGAAIAKLHRLENSIDMHSLILLEAVCLRGGVFQGFS